MGGMDRVEEEGVVSKSVIAAAGGGGGGGINCLVNDLRVSLIAYIYL